MPTTSPTEQIRQMAEEIFELQKLSWMGAAAMEQDSEHELSESEFLALDLLTKTESMNVGELQRAVGVLPAQMSRVIRNLERKSDKPLVACSLNPDDKRKIDVSLTDAGRQAHEAYQSSKLATAIGVLSELDQTDRTDFMRLLGVIREKMAQVLMSGRE